MARSRPAQHPAHRASANDVANLPYRDLHEFASNRLCELMPTTFARATLARLLHYADVCQCSDDSVRISRALPGKGVTPRS